MISEFDSVSYIHGEQSDVIRYNNLQFQLDNEVSCTTQITRVGNNITFKFLTKTGIILGETTISIASGSSITSMTLDTAHKRMDVLLDSGEHTYCDLTFLFDNKQDTLVSGTNIKTINNQNVLGSGNLNIPTIPQGGTTGQVLAKNSNIDLDVEWANAKDHRLPTTLESGKFVKVNSTASGFELAKTHKYPYLYVFHWERNNGGYPLSIYITMLSEGDMGSYNWQFRDYLMTHSNPIIALHGSCYIEKDGLYKLTQVQTIQFFTQYNNLYARVWTDDGDPFNTIVLGGQGGGDLQGSLKVEL